jgi:hypothetical protein
MSLNYSANLENRNNWQKIKCDTIDTTNLIVGNPISTINKTCSVSSDVGYLLTTPTPDTFFQLSKNRNITSWNNGGIVSPNGFNLPIDKAGIYNISVNAEVNVQTGLGGFLKIFLGKTPIDDNVVVGHELTSSGVSFNLSSLYKLDLGDNNLDIFAKYYGLSGETLGVATWNLALVWVSDI